MVLPVFKTGLAAIAVAGGFDSLPPPPLLIFGADGGSGARPTQRGDSQHFPIFQKRHFGRRRHFSYSIISQVMLAVLESCRVPLYCLGHQIDVSQT